nr:immunoglobulin heavy chain junction region [Mus musculus]
CARGYEFLFAYW